MHSKTLGFILHNRFFKDVLQNIDTLRENIILDSSFHYFDWTGSGLGLRDIENKIQRILPYYSNTHSSEDSIITNIYNKARENLKERFRLDSSFALISCGFGATSAIKKFQELLGIYAPPKLIKRLAIDKNSIKNKPLVIVGPYEHHSNEVSFREGICDVVRIKLTNSGLVDLSHLESVLQENRGREIIASFSLGSNVSGIVVPFFDISRLVRSYGGIVCFDMASTSAYFNIPCEIYDVAFISSHKLLGGIGGSGILIIKKELVDKSISPSFCGGGVVGYVSRSTQNYFSQEEIREEAGTPGILELIRASLAYSLRDEIGLEYIAEKKNQAHLEFLDFFDDKRVISYGNLEHNALSIFSFNIKNKNPYEIASILYKDNGILLRAGCACAGPYGHDLLGFRDNDTFSSKPGFLRVSLHYTHEIRDIQYLKDCLYKIIKK